MGEGEGEGKGRGKGKGKGKVKSKHYNPPITLDADGFSWWMGFCAGCYKWGEGEGVLDVTSLVTS